MDYFRIALFTVLLFAYLEAKIPAASCHFKMVIFPNYGTLICTTKYENPYYGDPQHGSPNLGKPVNPAGPEGGHALLAKGNEGRVQGLGDLVSRGR